MVEIQHSFLKKIKPWFYFNRFQNQPVFTNIGTKGNRLIFQLSPFRAWGKKAEKSLNKWMC
jgi:hypothetical protein